jgi:lipopolysaccharide export LptBFGC system permease protein LptF
LVLYSLLFLQYLSDYALEFNANSLGVWLQEFVYLVFSYLSWLFPISCFVATIFTISNLGKNRELLAMDASGISIFYICRPILILSLLCCILSWLCKDHEVIAVFFDNSVGWSPPTNGKETKSFHMNIDSEKRTWYFNNYDIYSNKGQGIYLYSYDEQGNDLFRIKAKTGFLTESGWELKNGYFLGFLTPKGIPILLKDHMAWDPYPAPARNPLDSDTFRPRFKKEFSVLYLPEIKDDPQPFALLRTVPSNLNFEELNSLIREFPSEDSTMIHPYKLRRAQLFWNAPACLLAAICALAISINRQQSSIGIIVGVSIIWISLFYILRTFCDALGEEGILKEWQASGIPFFVILLVSIAVLCRKR